MHNNNMEEDQSQLDSSKLSTEQSEQAQLQTFISKEDWPSAAELVYSLLKHQPESTWLHCNLGWIMFQMHDYETAELHLKIALQLNPHYTDAHANLAWVYYGLGRAGTADDNNQSALQLDPNNLRSIELATYLALHYDDINKAKTLFKRVQTLDDDPKLITDLRTAILSHPKNKENIDVDTQLQAHADQLEEDPKHAAAHYHSARLHLKYTKNYSEAHSHMSQALAIEPNHYLYKLGFMQTARRKNPLIRTLCYPFGLFSSDDRDYMEYVLILGLFAIATLSIFVTPELKTYLQQTLVICISLIAFIYPIIKVYDYLQLTEFYHETDNAHLFSGLFGGMHRQKYTTRLITCCSFTVAFWALTIYYLVFRF